MLLEGLQLPLTTPFYADGRLNLAKLAYNVERYSKTPVAGMVALSGWGEPTMLSEAETRLALRGVAEAAAAEKVLIAGASRDSVMGTLEIAEYAAELGYDAVLVKSPLVVSSWQAQLTYFQMVADRSPLPVVIDDDAAEMSVEMIAQLAEHPQIIALVDGSGDAERVASLKAATELVRHEVSVTMVFSAFTRRMRSVDGDGLIAAATLASGGEGTVITLPKAAVKTRKKVLGFQILTADTARIFDGLVAGAVGAVPGLAASAPQACYEVLAAWKDGDEPLAREKQERLQEPAAKIELGLGVAGVKYGGDLNGYYGGWPRLPLLPLSGEERSEVERLMQDLRN